MPRVCSICSSEKSSFVGKKEVLGGNNSSVEILRCEICDHLYSSPIPSQWELNQYYKSTSELVLGSGWTENYLLEDSNPVSMKILEEVISSSPDCVLEVGCGNGELLRRIHKLDYQVYGIEPGSWLKQENIFPELEALPSELIFDYVIIQDVMEHVESPLDFLREISSKTGNSATFIITVPAGDSTEARKFGVDWEMIRPLGHLHYFSAKSIEFLADELNLEVIKIEKFRREQRTKSIMRVILFPLLRLRHMIRRTNSTNPYLLANLINYVRIAYSQGDQYFVILAKM